MSRIYRFVLAIPLLLSIHPRSLMAQATAGTGGLTGTVRDATGSVVAGAAVTVANDAKGIRRALNSNDAGVFSAPALTPSAGYRVTVEKAGFNKFETTELTIEVGQDLNLNISLQVASTTTQVEVTATTPIIEDTKTDVSQVINQRLIQDLPINGRRVDSFVLNAPAVVPDGTFGLVSFRGVAGHNAFLTDGNDTTNGYYNENAGRTRISSQISQDAVQEFQVISNNFAAEYGSAMGGVVNTITKSGANQLHGSGYWFFRNQDFNARDRYATVNPLEKRNQFGGSVGGKIIKDKLFYFFNYEGTRRNFPLISSVTSANLFTPQGTLDSVKNPCPDPNAVIPATGQQCSAAIQMLTTRNFGTVPRTVRSDLGFGKLDYHLNDRHTLSVSVNALRWVSPHGIQTQGVLTDGNGIGNNADSTVRTVYGRAALTSVFGATKVNEFRFGFFKDRLYDAASPDFLYPGLGRAGLTINSTGNLGVATSYPRLNPSERRYEFADNFTWTRGAHTMKFGGDINNTFDFQNSLANQYGSYSYSSLNAFALDFSGNGAGLKSWNTYSQRFGNPIVATNLRNVSFYGQDQWRVNSRLLINYGLRYDYTFIRQPTIINPDYPQTGVIPSANKNFAPRVGASYAFGAKHDTILRAGYGIFYARYQGGLINSLFLNNNIYQQSITYNSGTAAQLAAGPIFPNFLSATNFAPPAGTVDINFADKNMRNPYTHQANVSLEHQFGTNMSVTASYIWSRGVRLYTVRDLNVGAPAGQLSYYVLGADGALANIFTTNIYKTPRPDPRYRRISQEENGGLSYYDGLALQFNRRFSKGLQASVAYTWSHAIDFNQSGASNNIFFGTTPTDYLNGNQASEKGSSTQDIRHRAVISFVYSHDFLKSHSAVAKYIANGWQLSGITTLMSSPPVNPTLNISGNAYTGALVSGSLNGIGGGFSRSVFDPVDSLNLDRTYRVDTRLAKRFDFSERYQLYAQFEVFNLTNTPVDTGRRTPKYNLGTGAAGTSLAGLPVLSYISSYGSGNASQGFPDGTNARRAQVSLRFVF